MSGRLPTFAALAGIAPGLIFTFAASAISPLRGAQQAPPIAGIRCDRDEHLKYHIHAHLDIFTDGKPHPVPEGVGIVGRSCLYWLHTHDRSGIIHVEAPQARHFTLDQFFLVWNATAQTAPAVKQTPKIFVNGKRISGGLVQVEMADLAQIAVIYGKEPPKIPSSYDFPDTYKYKYR
ncbi:MAG: hypothetical protein HYY14_05995 [Candidatus Omnitrophica bacterium]|nr:hypothetical protein [Candidatus Omnitrophota bacterium]